MSSKQLEQRVSKLESEFELMKASQPCNSGQGWRAVVGGHKGSSAFDNVVREMRRLRREDYRQATGKHSNSEE